MAGILKTIHAIVESDGTVRLEEPLSLTGPVKAVVTLLLEGEESESALLSEQALAKDWNREEEDTAWAHLQEER